MCTNTRFVAESPRNTRRGAPPHLRNTADWTHGTRGTQRLQCWPFPGKKYYGFNREDFVFTRPPGVERFVLSPDNVWYCRLKLLFTLYVHIDGQDEPVELECAYVSFCYEIKLEPSGVS